MFSEGCGRARFVVGVDLVVVASGGKEVGVGGGDLGPNHVASGQVGLLAHGIEPGFVGEQGADFAGDRGGIAEGDEDTGLVGQQLRGVPIRSRDHRFAGAEAVGERARGDLGLVEVGGDVNVSRADVLAEFLVGHVAVDEADAVFHADAAGHAFELQAVALAFLADEVRMGGAEHNVNEPRVVADDVGQGSDDIFDPFVRREQAEGEHDRTPGDFELVLVKARIGEAGVGNAVRDDGDFRVGDAVEAGQHAAGALGHDDQTRGKVDEFVEHPALVGVRVFQHGVEGGDDGHAHPAEEGEDVAAGRPPEDAEFMLQAEHVHVGEVEEVGRAHVGGDIGLRDFEADLGRVGIVSGAVGHGDDRAAPIRIGRNDGIAQVAGEGGDAALPRGIVAEKSDFINRRKRSHQA